MPAPCQTFVELQRPENLQSLLDIYKSVNNTKPYFIKAYKNIIHDLYDAGCRIIQIDDCIWPGLVDWHNNPDSTPFFAVDDPPDIEKVKRDLIELNNAIFDGIPNDLIVQTHICCGNYHSTWIY